jgi:hypothetical protein
LDAYRYQQMAYLVVPVLLGMEFFITAKNEREHRSEATLGSYLLDICGFLAMAIIPALFIFTIWAIATDAFLWKHTLARLDRYGVMFLFLGAWWQVYMITALRARRMVKNNGWRMGVFGPLLGLGLYISMDVLWVSPFGLKWISTVWFLTLAALLYFLKAGPKTVERVFWSLAILTFFAMNVVFMWLDAVI